MLDRFLLYMNPELKEQYKPTDPTNIGSRLQDLGYRVMKTTELSAVAVFIEQVDALIVCTSPADVGPLAKQCLKHRSLPLIWWSHYEPHGNPKCQIDIDIDAMLSPFMTDNELHWSLHLCANRYLQRIQWHKEREQLLSKLDERKHIDKAKAILCKTKNISEPEAYEFLRKQAMYERKRMVDVATSILHVYPLLVTTKGDGMK